MSNEVDEWQDTSGTPREGIVDSVDTDAVGADQEPLDLQLGSGLTALVGGDGPLRIEVMELFARRLALHDERLQTLIAGPGPVGPALAWRRAVRILAQWSGLEGVDQEEAALIQGGSGAAGPPDSGVDGLRARVEELRRLPEALRVKARELRGLRADGIEVGGDLEVANMDWLRERQDAETHLLAYRDRARELKVRLQQLEEGGKDTACPTCDRVLSERFESVLDVIREEWESVVQDGSWWKRRKDQLDLKPPHVQDLEGKTLRLHATIEECTEEVERLRARLPELAEAEDTLAMVQVAGGPSESGESKDAESSSDSDLRRRALEALRRELLSDARDALTARTGRYLNHLTSGGVLGVGVAGDGEPTIVRDEGARRIQSDEEVAAYLFALRLALVDLAADRGVHASEILLGDTFDRLEPDAKLRAVGLLRTLLVRVPKILLFCRGDILDATPEWFDWIVELAVDRHGSPFARVRRSGVGTLQIH
ncbi:MAG: hypothetical protein IID07_03435 [Gemmatimonadetes bacterium]|nr:hypothetical protein [Gemmatimonadota bacterium]